MAVGIGRGSGCHCQVTLLRAEGGQAWSCHRERLGVEITIVPIVLEKGAGHHCCHRHYQERLGWLTSGKSGVEAKRKTKMHMLVLVRRCRYSVAGYIVTTTLEGAVVMSDARHGDWTVSSSKAVIE